MRMQRKHIISLCILLCALAVLVRFVLRRMKPFR